MTLLVGILDICGSLPSSIHFPSFWSSPFAPRSTCIAASVRWAVLWAPPSLPSVHIAMEFHPRILQWPCAQIRDSGLSKVVVIMLNLWTVGKTTEMDPHFVVRPQAVWGCSFCSDFAGTILKSLGKTYFYHLSLRPHSSSITKVQFWIMHYIYHVSEVPFSLEQFLSFSLIVLTLNL